MDSGKVIEAQLVEEEEIAKTVEIEEEMTPIIQTCTLKTKHGKTVDCKFWVHTDKYFQYYEKGYVVEDLGNEKYIIRGDTVIVPEHEIQWVIIRNAASAIPESMFLALGGKKKLIKVVK